MAVERQDDNSQAVAEHVNIGEDEFLEQLTQVGCPYIIKGYGRSLRHRNTPPHWLGFLYMEWVCTSILSTLES
jgi:hypothetical protein